MIIAIVRRGMVSVLRDQLKDAEFGEAENSRQGFAAVLKEPWDLVIVDISMPGRSGLELIRTSRMPNPGFP